MQNGFWANKKEKHGQMNSGILKKRSPVIKFASGEIKGWILGDKKCPKVIFANNKMRRYIRGMDIPCRMYF